ncbi:MAG: heme biosynthesis HemY N-terminal domain-containing protein [Gallionella sp.]|jgi:HemY protein
MKYLISILVLFATAVALATLLQNTAYVLLVYPPYRIEVSLKLFVVLFLLVFGFGYWLIHLLLATTQLPAEVQKIRLDRAKNNARKLLDVALRAFFEGRYAEAEKAALRAIKHGENSVLYGIIAARAAHELKAFERRNAYLSSAQNQSQGESTMRMLVAAKNKFDQADER